jgi:hypothetical protein
MKKIFLLLFFANLLYGADAQLTYVPDDAFEAYLENLGFGNNVQNDNYVNSAFLSSQGTLAIDGSNYPINDFTGIEAFTSLSELFLNNFFLNTINISAITSNSIQIHVFSCPGLVNLHLPLNICAMEIQINNSLKNLIFLPNTAFVNGPSNNFSIIGNNSLEQLDFSQITISSSIILFIESNPILRCLNLKNGYCFALTLVQIAGNDLLSCVEVDNPIYSSSASTWVEYQSVVYSNNCGNCILSFENVDQFISLYPNPTSSEITITSDKFTNEPYTLFDQMGRTVGSGKLNGTTTTISLSTLSKGIYILKVEGAYESAIVVKE